jgi:thiol-disulfide isomerase/thioredoxin
MPSLAGVTEWLNGEPRWDALRDGPVLVHFWAVSCHICHDNMPTIAAWRDGYAAKGLTVIAIHRPREESDTDVARVREDMSRMRMTEPCGVDNNVAVADAFDNGYVPAYFLFDRAGALRSRSGGDAGLGLLKGALSRQLGEA